MTWQPPTVDSDYILGYSLYQIDYTTGEKSEIYNGYRNANTRQYTVYDLTPGVSYGYQVKAYNFNGAGEESVAAYFKPCTAPSNLAAPVILETTRSSLAFRWTPPGDDGACPITGYVLYLDDGVSGGFAAVDTDEIANRDYLRSHTVTFDASDEGKVFRYLLEASNEIGSV